MKSPPLLITGLLYLTCAFSEAGSVVINEIHYDEDDKTVRAEFIELHNPTATPVDLSGFYFSRGIDYTFPGGASLPANGFVVVAEDPATMLSKFGVAGAFGPFAAGTKLKNSGEKITLRDPAGTLVDTVDYALGFPWPTVGGEVGTPLASPSIELINPLIDNDLGGSWRASGFPVGGVEPGGGGPVMLVAAGADWRYRKGTSYPAVDGTGKDWRDNGYVDGDDGAWLDGITVIGYGDGDDTTVLTDMQQNYISIFLRKEFTIAAGQVPDAVTVRCYYDDGAVVYLNGVEVARFSVDAGPVPFPPPNGFANSHEAAWTDVEISGVSAYLVAGVNVLAIQCINATLGSSDLSIDAELITIPAGAGGGSNAPTPGAANASFASNVPPQIRQVNHAPVGRILLQDKTILSGEAMLVTARITGSDGVGTVSLAYQSVDPGDYFCRYNKFNNDGSPNLNARYEDPAEWTSVAMLDDGSGGDALAGDSTFTVTLPGSLQLNRRLVRYRITAAGTSGTTITVPYNDDPQPNFAYYIYDGTPDWSGVIRPGDTAVNHPGALMSSIPTYFLLSTNTWVDDSQFGFYRGSEYLWPGTLVYDGEVYDHIQYRPRGGGRRFDNGKNFWKFNFTRGHRFQARDRYGKRYDTSWRRLNFSSIVQLINAQHRGEQGLFEGVSFRFFELCGVESCETHYTQFYVVDQASPTGANQYESDYYGLFLAIEQIDGQYLDQHDLPDGNLYKIETHIGDLKNQGPDQVSDGSDVSAFINTYRNTSPTAAWWNDNLDIEKYLSYRAVVEGIHHYDIANGKNYYYYHNPVTDKFEVHPWDLDLTWGDDVFGTGNHDFKSMVAENPAFNTAYQNRVREIMDLLYNSDEGYRLIDESVRHVWTPGAPSLVSADRRLWDNNPRIVVKDLYYDAAFNNEFSGMIQILKDYIVSRGSWMTTNLLTDRANIPATPTITFSGTAGFPTNDMRFTSSAYSSPGGTAFAAMQWRVAEVYNPTVAAYVAGEPYLYEIENPTESGELVSFDPTYHYSPLAVRAGQTYRARVRHRDSAGRWGHWSDPVEFTAGVPDLTIWTNNLMITEIMYHPSNATTSEVDAGFSNSDFEYIELRNISTTLTLDLSELRFTKGIDFDFIDGAITALAPGESVLVVRDTAAFESRHGTGLPIAGAYAPDNLRNNGENLKLSFGAGETVHEFVYDDRPSWPTGADGHGPSLTLIAPESAPPLADPFSWRSSVATGGSPGTGDATAFTGDPDADDNGDGLSAFLEYALGISSGAAPHTAALPQVDIAVFDDGTGTQREYLTITYQRNLAADDVTYEVQTTTALIESSWSDTPGTTVYMSSADNGDGTAAELWRSAVPIGDYSQEFIRLRVGSR